MKLLLTSTGFTHPEIFAEFVKLLTKPISDVRIAFVKTASRSDEELKYADKSFDELLENGIPRVNIINFDFSIKNKVTLQNFDVLYVCGGNTFHLLNEINKNGYRSEILNFINSDKIYFGVSAGSIMVTPSIEIASVEPADPNDVNLQDLTGLNIVNFEVSPHSPEIVPFETVAKYAEDNKRKIWAFSDRSALLVHDSTTKIVGEGLNQLFDFS